MKKKKIFACQFLNYNLDVLIKVKFFSICGIYIFIAEKKIIFVQKITQVEKRFTF